jgi:apolipoprotein N-acyltransferase
MKTDAVAYSPSGRIAAAVLTAISRGSPVVVLVLLVFFETRLTNPLRLLRAFATVCLAPGLAAWLLRRAFAASVTIEHGMLVLQRGGERTEIPCEAIDAVEPWVVPLPAGGIWLRLRSGRRFRYGLEIGDPIAFADALVDAGAPAHVRTSRHPAALHARARRRWRRRWYQPLLKYVVFALVPTLPLFRLHQWVAYGGTFGEYYAYGLEAYLLAFAIHWATYTIYLVLYGAALRVAAEAIALAAAWTAPSRAAGARRAVEVANRILYYGGVPLFLVRLFLA